MQRHALHTIADFVHQHLRPLVVVVRGTASDTVELVAGIVTQIGIELAELVRVVFRCHIATTAPSLVANAEVFDLPGFFTTILTTQTSHRRITVAGHIFHPLRHLLHRA